MPGAFEEAIKEAQVPIFVNSALIQQTISAPLPINDDPTKTITIEKPKRLYASDFKEWKIYQKEDFLIFIPHKYYEKYGTTNMANLAFNIKNFNEVTPETWQLPSMKSMGYQQYENASDHNHRVANNNKNFLRTVRLLLNCPKILPTNIYITGHGGKDKYGQYKACNIAPKTFIEFLKFLNDTARMNSFYYETCHGTTIQNTIPKTNFPIICQGFQDVGTYKETSLSTIFKQLHTINSAHCCTITPEKIEPLNNKTAQAIFLNNLTVIRRAGESTFEFPYMPNLIYDFHREKQTSYTSQSPKIILLGQDGTELTDFAIDPLKTKIIFQEQKNSHHIKTLVIDGSRENLLRNDAFLTLLFNNLNLSHSTEKTIYIDTVKFTKSFKQKNAINWEHDDCLCNISIVIPPNNRAYIRFGSTKENVTTPKN